MEDYLKTEIPMSVGDMIGMILVGFGCWFISMLLLAYAKTMFSKSIEKNPLDIVVFRLGVVGLYGGILIFWRTFYFAPPNILPEVEWVRYGSYITLTIFGFYFAWLAKQVWKTSYVNSGRNSITHRAAARS